MYMFYLAVLTQKVMGKMVSVLALLSLDFVERTTKDWSFPIPTSHIPETDGQYRKELGRIKKGSGLEPLAPSMDHIIVNKRNSRIH